MGALAKRTTGAAGAAGRNVTRSGRPQRGHSPGPWPALLDCLDMTHTAPASYDRSIVAGPLAGAVWRLAWPAMLVNIIGGMQSLVDQVLVGHIVGYTGNAAIGVANQVFIAIFIFITSLFTGMSVLVSRFAGAGDVDKVNRTVYQACITAVGLAVFVMAPAGFLLAPSLLDFVNAAPAVQAQALPFLRIMFLTSSGMLVYFMLAGACAPPATRGPRWSSAS
jgi:Na+-driven multidrug efflux pump